MKCLCDLDLFYTSPSTLEKVRRSLNLDLFRPVPANLPCEVKDVGIWLLASWRVE